MADLLYQESLLVGGLVYRTSVNALLVCFSSSKVCHLGNAVCNGTGNLCRVLRRAGKKGPQNMLYAIDGMNRYISWKPIITSS